MISQEERGRPSLKSENFKNILIRKLLIGVTAPIKCYRVQILGETPVFRLFLNQFCVFIATLSEITNYEMS